MTKGGVYGGEMAKYHREADLGAGRAVLFRLADCYAVLAGVLGRGRGGFPPCRECPVRPRVVAATVPSDWDDKNQCLRPDSAAWTY